MDVRRAGPTLGVLPSLTRAGPDTQRSRSVPPPGSVRRGVRQWRPRPRVNTGMVGEATRLLKEARAEMDPSDAATRSWGNGPLGSVLDAPLASAPGTSHKPALLQSLEEGLTQALNALNHRCKGEPFTKLPTAPADPSTPKESRRRVRPGASPGNAPSTPQSPALQATVGMLVCETPPTSASGSPLLPAQPPAVASALEPNDAPRAVLQSAGAAVGFMNSEDRYRADRHTIFSRFSRDFARSFKTYRPLLCWMVSEFDGYREYLVGCVSGLRGSLEASNALRDDAVERADRNAREFAQVRRSLEREAVAHRRKADRVRAEMERWHAAQERNVDELRSLQEQLDDAEEAKVQLHKQVNRLERQLHEEKTQDAERKLRLKVEHDLDKVTRQWTEVQRLHEMVLRENRFLKDRVEELQQQMRGQRGRVAHRPARPRTKKEETTMTPRPDWDRPPVSTSLQYVQQSTAHSVQAAALVVQELERQVAEAQAASATGDGNAAFNILNKKWLLGLGTDEDIRPAFLRATGRFPNQRMRKAQVESVVKEFWKEKGRTKEATSMSCADFFVTFLKRKHGDAKVNEHVYNIWFALLRNRADPDCDLFLRLLRGEAEEAMWHVQTHMLTRVADAFNEADVSNERRLAVDSITAVVRELFPAKEDEQIALLEQALLRMPGARDEGVAYAELFVEDEDCSQSPFVEMLRAQYVREGDEFIRELEEAVVEFDECSDGIITPTELSRATWSLDPDFPGTQMDDFLARAFRVHVEDLQPQANPLAAKRHVRCIGQRTYGCGDSVSVPLAKILQRVRDLVHSGCARRHTKRSQMLKDSPPVELRPSEMPAEK